MHTGRDPASLGPIHLWPVEVKAFKEHFEWPSPVLGSMRSLIGDQTVKLLVPAEQGLQSKFEVGRKDIRRIVDAEELVIYDSNDGLIMFSKIGTLVHLQ